MAEKLTPETEECYKRVPASFPKIGSIGVDQATKGLN